jgi:hypothetical protein
MLMISPVQSKFTNLADCIKKQDPTMIAYKKCTSLANKHRLQTKINQKRQIRALHIDKGNILSIKK